MILPIIVAIVILYGLYKHIDIYDKFINGVKESYTMILTLFPSLLAMNLAVNIFTSSGIINKIFTIVNLHFLPSEILPLMILRPISGSSSLAILTQILNTSGPDSYLGVLASVLQGSTDTTIYILTLYFGSVGIKKTRYALINGLLTDMCAFIIAYLVVTWLT